MNDEPAEIVYRPDPDTPSARVLADLERLAATRAELPGRLVRSIIDDPVLPLTDLTALRTITCTDDTAIPVGADETLDVRIERRNAPAASRTTAEPVPIVDPVRLRIAAEHAAEAEMTGIDLDAVLRTTDELDRAALLTMLHTLDIPSEGVDVSHLMGAAAPDYRPLVRRWLAALAAHGLLDRIKGPGGSDRVCSTTLVTATDVAEAWNRVEISWRQSISAHPNFVGSSPPHVESATLAYARANAEQLPELVRGTVSPMSLLFPDGSLDVARALYREPPVARYQLAAVAGFVAELAAAAPAGQPLRFLEVGGGTGATTERVLVALEHHPVDYLFTDVSDYFLTVAGEQFGTGRFPSASFQVAKYDIDGDRDQSIRGDFDVVLAGGVLNNARDTDHSLRLLTDHLAPGGWLLITEPTREVQWIAISQAFLMTAATDDRQRSGDTFLSYPQWLAAFDRTAGLELVLDLPPSGHPLTEAGHKFFALKWNDTPAITRSRT